MFSSHLNAQEYILDEKVVTGIFEAEKNDKSELFSSINKWISINYNSAKNVIQMNDKESGTIIIKGINEVAYKNPMKTIYPNNKYAKEYATIKFNHLIEINIKDNRYRIIFRITDIASQDAGANHLIFKCINFKGTNDESINEYNEFNESFLKAGMVGKKKRELFKSLSKPMFVELSKNTVTDIKLTLKSIEVSLETKAKDDW